MKKYIEHLKSKGYKVNGNIAMLQNVRFKICEGKIETAMGVRTSRWMEVIG